MIVTPIALVCCFGDCIAIDGQELLLLLLLLQLLLVLPLRLPLRLLLLLGLLFARHFCDDGGADAGYRRWP